VQTRILLLQGNPSSAYLSEVLLGCLADASLNNSQLMLESVRTVIKPKSSGVRSGAASMAFSCRRPSAIRAK